MARGLIAIVLVVAACAEPAPPTLEAGSLEAALPASIWPADPSLVSDVACPDLDIELIAQATTCTAVLDADAVTVDVVVDEAGAATAEVRETLFVVAEAAATLVDRLEDDLGLAGLGVDCAGTVLVPAAGRRLECRATGGSRPIDVALVFLGEGDAWTLELAD